jgi:protein required for attachment to host cells
MTTIVAVAQRAKARLFRHDGPQSGLTEIRDLAHPESRAHGIDLETDRAGRVADRRGPGRHALEVEEPPKEREAANFAREVAAALKDVRTHQGFDRLVLVAEPGFLGLLRGALDHTTAKLIDGEVHKEIVDEKVDEIAAHLEGVL